MNMIKALFSGDRIFKEEFASSFLGYALSPFKDHGFGYDILIDLLEPFDELKKLSQTLKERKLNELELFASDFNIENPAENITLLEYENIDITIKIGEFILIFENKIYPCSIGQRGINAQLLDYYLIMKNKFPAATIIPFAIYPDGERTISPLDLNNQDIICYELSWRGSANSISEILKEKFPEFSEFINNNFIGFREYNQDKAHIDLEDFLAKNFPQQKVVGDFLIELLQNYSTAKDETLCDWDGPILCIRNADNTKTAWPFKIKTDGKIVIQHQGLSSKPFSYRTWRYENKNIIEIIKLILNKNLPVQSQFDFNHFYIQDMVKDENKKANFKYCLSVLEDIIKTDNINEIIKKNI